MCSLSRQQLGFVSRRCLVPPARISERFIIAMNHYIDLGELFSECSRKRLLHHCITSLVSVKKCAVPVDDLFQPCKHFLSVFRCHARCFQRVDLVLAFRHSMLLKDSFMFLQDAICSNAPPYGSHSWCFVMSHLRHRHLACNWKEKPQDKSHRIALHHHRI